MPPPDGHARSDRGLGGLLGDIGENALVHHALGLILDEVPDRFVHSLLASKLGQLAADAAGDETDGHGRNKVAQRAGYGVIVVAWTLKIFIDPLTLFLRQQGALLD